MKHLTALSAALTIALPAYAAAQPAPVRPTAQVTIAGVKVDISSRIQVSTSPSGETLYTIPAQDVKAPNGASVTVSSQGSSQADFAYTLSSVNPFNSAKTFGFDEQIPVVVRPAGQLLTTTLLGELTAFGSTHVSIDPIRAGVQQGTYSVTRSIGFIGAAQANVIPSATFVNYGPSDPGFFFRPFFSSSATAAVPVTAIGVHVLYAEAPGEGVSLRGTAGRPSVFLAQ